MVITMKETIVYGKTIALALKRGAEELDIDEAKAEYEVLEEPKKGFFGVGASDAKLRVFYQPSPAEIAADFVQDLLMNMQFEANVSIESADEEGAAIAVSGEGLGLLIGRHGDVLDAVQHLAGLAANHGRSGYYRITVDIENYRAKRAETLRQLARRMAEKTLKYRRNNTLEPMNAYERRIIHTEVQSIEGVTTYSIGSDADRRIVIALDKKSKNRDADGDSAEA